MIWVVCPALGWFRSYPDLSSDPDHPPIDSHASSPGRWFVAREDVQRHRSHRHYSTCPVNWYQLIVILLTSWDKKRTTRYPRWLSGPLRLRNSSLACSASPSHGSPSWIVLWEFCGRPWDFLFLSAQRHPAAYGCRKCKVFHRKLSQIVYLHIQMRWVQSCCRWHKARHPSKVLGGSTRSGCRCRSPVVPMELVSQLRHHSCWTSKSNQT